MPAPRTLFRTSALTVLDVRCPAHPPPASDVEVEPSFAAVLPRRGVFVYHAPGRRLVADPTVAFLLTKGAEHRTTHPADGGDRNTVISFPDDVAAAHLTPGDAFPAPPRPVRLGDFLRHQAMLAAIRDGNATALEVDEWGCGVVAALAGADAVPGRAAHVLAAAAREYLAAHYSDDADLRAVARAVGSSPHHLSRVFAAATGRTLSACRTELRLRHVVDRLADGHPDLAALAVEAGFFDHAHMTRTMTRHAGAAPSRLRELLAA